MELFQSGGVAETAVLGFLVCFSIYSWTIIFSKWTALSGARKANSRFLRAFRKAMTKPAADGDHVRQGVEAYWAHVRHPLFVAFFELAVAARSDKELASILRPAQEAFEGEWHKAAVDVFPEWRGRGDKFDLALDLSRYVLEGMAISFLTHKETERDQRVLGYLDEKIRELAGLPAAPKSSRA